MASSLSYALVVGLPCVLLAFVWLLCHVGTSAVALIHVLAGRSCSRRAASPPCLSWLSWSPFRHCHPVSLFLTTVYTYLLPVFYPASMIPARWQFTHTFAVPLSPTITILRQGMLNQGSASGSIWMAALLHAIAGYALAVWIWRRNT